MLDLVLFFNGSQYDLNSLHYIYTFFNFVISIFIILRQDSLLASISIVLNIFTLFFHILPHFFLYHLRVMFLDFLYYCFWTVNFVFSPLTFCHPWFPQILLLNISSAFVVLLLIGLLQNKAHESLFSLEITIGRQRPIPWPPKYAHFYIWRTTQIGVQGRAKKPDEAWSCSLVWNIILIFV